MQKKDRSVIVARPNQALDSASKAEYYADIAFRNVLNEDEYETTGDLVLDTRMLLLRSREALKSLLSAIEESSENPAKRAKG